MLKPSAANTPNTKATLFVLGNVVAVSCDDQKVSSCLYLRHTVIKTETTNIVHAYYTRYFYAPFILKLLLQFKKYCFLKDGKIFKCLSFSNLYFLRTVKYILIDYLMINLIKLDEQRFDIYNLKIFILRTAAMFRNCPNTQLSGGSVPVSLTNQHK